MPTRPNITSAPPSYVLSTEAGVFIIVLSLPYFLVTLDGTILWMFCFARDVAQEK